MKWETYFLQMAQLVKTKSKDENTQIGAVIVGSGNEVVSTGYNSFPRGINDTHAYRQEKPEKYFWFEHAERNSIYNAARIGVSTLGCRMFLTCDIPCADCARGIINAGIVEVHCIIDGGANGIKWSESAIRSAGMFNEAGVKWYYYNKDFEPIG